MNRIIILSVLQSFLLAGGQVWLKIGLQKMEPFGWDITFWKSALLNWQLALCGIFFALSGFLWLHLIKTYPLSTVYPLSAISFIFGMIAAILVFHEDVNLTKWIGAVLIVGGCYLIVK